MTRAVKSESRKNRTRIFKPSHEEPKDFYLDYILLPYGQFYEKTRVFLEAKTGDILRFFNGPEFPIESVTLIKCDKVCDILCRMRYGISWEAAFSRWCRYVMLEGNGRSILSKEECIFVVYRRNRNGDADTTM